MIFTRTPRKKRFYLIGTLLINKVQMKIKILLVLLIVEQDKLTNWIHPSQCNFFGSKPYRPYLCLYRLWLNGKKL